MTNHTNSEENSPVPETAAQPSLGDRSEPLVVRVIGVGGAGGQAVAHMATTDLRQLRLVALHTSTRILEMSPAPEKRLLGAQLTHGLGAGGDPSLARAAAERDLDLLRDLCEKVDLLFVVVGLGGGTGTGVAPVLARVAKEAGALAVGVATLPFDLEGPRRRRQACQGLAELRAAADTVICLPNQKIFQIVDENTSVLEGLRIANDLLAQGIRGIWHMLTRPSLLHVDFAHLTALLRDRHLESSFAAVQAQGGDRARVLIDELLACPLLDGGQTFAGAEAVIVNLSGGPDLTMAEVKRVMEEVNRWAEGAQVVMGTSVSHDLQGSLGLTLVVARSSVGEDARPVTARGGEPHPSSAFAQADARIFESSVSTGRSAAFGFPHSPRLVDRAPGDGGSAAPTSGPVRFTPSRMQQGNLPLEIVSKGRFEKSHPTLHRGEDLDVPTYVRRGIPLN